MITIDCPWCDSPVALDGLEWTLRCHGCAIQIEVAPDETGADVRRAA